MLDTVQPVPGGIHHIGTVKQHISPRGLEVIVIPRPTARRTEFLGIGENPNYLITFIDANPLGLNLGLEPPTINLEVKGPVEVPAAADRGRFCTPHTAQISGKGTHNIH